MTSELLLPPHATVARDPAPISADLDGEVVVLSVDKGKYYSLNEVGSRIWALMERPISVASLIEILMGEFEVERTLCQGEVLAFLGELHRDGLVQIFEPRTYRRRAAVEMRQLTGAGILIDTQGSHFGINQVGVRIWELLGDAASIDAVVEALLREFEVSDRRCRAHAEAFLAELLERGLVERT